MEPMSPSARCHESQCLRRGVFSAEPVRGYRVKFCRPCFKSRYGVAAPWLLTARPTPRNPDSIEIVVASESIKAMRASGFGPAIPLSYRRKY